MCEQINKAVFDVKLNQAFPSLHPLIIASHLTQTCTFQQEVLLGFLEYLTQFVAEVRTNSLNTLLKSITLTLTNTEPCAEVESLAHCDSQSRFCPPCCPPAHPPVRFRTHHSITSQFSLSFVLRRYLTRARDFLSTQDIPLSADAIESNMDFISAQLDKLSP